MGRLGKLYQPAYMYQLSAGITVIFCNRVIDTIITVLQHLLFVSVVLRTRRRVCAARSRSPFMSIGRFFPLSKRKSFTIFSILSIRLTRYFSDVEKDYRVSWPIKDMRRRAVGGAFRMSVNHFRN